MIPGRDYSHLIGIHAGITSVWRSWNVQDSRKSLADTLAVRGLSRRRLFFPLFLLWRNRFYNIRFDWVEFPKA